MTPAPAPRRAGSSFGDRAPILARDGGAMVYLALAPDDVAHRVLAGSTDRGLTPGLHAGAAAVGEVAVVRVLLSWGRQRMNLFAVEALQLPRTLIGPQQAATLARQLQRASEACDMSPRGGIGLSARGTAGLVRGFPCLDDPILLSTVTGGALWAARGGLLLDLLDRRIVVLGWRVKAAQLYARTPDRELDLTGTIAENLLTRLAPGLDEVVVRQVPLRSIFADLFVGAVGRARQAATFGIPMLCWHNAGP